MKLQHLIETDDKDPVLLALGKIGNSKLRKILLDTLGASAKIKTKNGFSVDRILITRHPVEITVSVDLDDDVDFVIQMFTKLIQSLFAPHLPVEVLLDGRDVEHGLPFFALKVFAA